MRSTELPATRVSMLASTSIPTDCGRPRARLPTPWTVLDSIVARRAPVTRMPSTPTTSSVGREPTSITVLWVIDGDLGERLAVHHDPVPRALDEVAGDVEAADRREGADAVAADVAHPVRRDARRAAQVAERGDAPRCRRRASAGSGRCPVISLPRTS